MKPLLIIPARGGSTRVPNKNLALINGKPLIYYSIKSAQMVDNIDILVSTDSKQIAKVAESLGVKVPYLRPSNLANENSTSISVIVHALNYLIENNCTIPEIVLFKPPTNPLLTPSSIQNMLDMKNKYKEIDSILTIHQPRLSALNFVSYSPVDKKIKTQIYNIDGIRLYDIERSQDRPLSYASSPACKITETKFFIDKYIDKMNLAEECVGPTFNPDNAYGYLINDFEAFDIDNIKDLDMTRLIINDSEKFLDRKLFNHILLE